MRLFWRDRDGQDGSGQISRNHGTFGSQPVAVPSEERVNPGSRPSAVTPGLDSAAAPDRAKRGATAPSATRIARNSGDSASLQESRTRTFKQGAAGLRFATHPSASSDATGRMLPRGTDRARSRDPPGVADFCFQDQPRHRRTRPSVISPVQVAREGRLRCRPDPSARVRRDCCLPARSRGRYETCAFHPVERRSSLALPRASCIAVRADSVRAGHSATSLLLANTRADPRTAGALALPPARNSRWTIPSSVWRKGMGLRHGSVGGRFARCDAVQRGALLHRSDGQGAVGARSGVSWCRARWRGNRRGGESLAPSAQERRQSPPVHPPSMADAHLPVNRDGRDPGDQSAVGGIG